MSIYKLLVKITVMRQPCLTIIISYFDQIFRLEHFILIIILSRHSLLRNNLLQFMLLYMGALY